MLNTTKLRIAFYIILTLLCIGGLVVQMCKYLKWSLVLPRLKLAEKKAVVDEEKSIIKATIEKGKEYMADIFEKRLILITATYHGVNTRNIIGTTSLYYFYNLIPSIRYLLKGEQRRSSHRIQ